MAAMMPSGKTCRIDRACGPPLRVSKADAAHARKVYEDLKKSDGVPRFRGIHKLKDIDDYMKFLAAKAALHDGLGGYLAPTKRVDRVWHKHILMDLKKYKDTVVAHCGQPINHRTDFPKNSLDRMTRNFKRFRRFVWQKKKKTKTDRPDQPVPSAAASRPIPEVPGPAAHRPFSFNDSDSDIDSDYSSDSESDGDMVNCG